MLVSSLILSVFDTTPVTKESLNDLKKQDVLSEMMKELGEQVPTLKTVLIDERDEYLAEKIIQTDGDKVVAVVGAGHVEGIKSIVQSGQRTNLDALDLVPSTCPASFSAHANGAVPHTFASRIQSREGLWTCQMEILIIFTTQK